VLLARRGAKVIVIDRVLKAAQDTVAMITREGGAALAFEADVSREADC
jgi:NAD(P)-dependent dehydrogenase (short-subunit alcohol dehydrogenase family)